MKLIRTFIFAMLALVMLPAVAQQSGPPVRWRAIVKMGADNTGTLTIKALVAEGWHLYGFDLPEGGPKPTTIDLSESVGLDFTGPIAPARPAITVDDPLFGMTLSWWDSNVEFKVPFKLTADSGMFKCKINYMTCDGTTCRPPATEILTGTVKHKAN